MNPPRAPSNLTAVLTFGPTVTLGWQDNSTNETSFIIERATNGGAFSQIGTVGAGVIKYVDTTAQPATTYSYRVAANNALGNSTYSNTVQVIVPAPPAAPTNLTATQQPGLRMNLTWRDNANNESSFIVERSTDGTNFTQIAFPPARNGTGNVTYVDTTIQPGITYWYRVAARNLIVQSAYSNTVQVAVPALPAKPTILSAVAVRQGNNNERVTLTWSAVPGVTGYTIQWAPVNFGPIAGTGNVGPNTTTFTTGNILWQVWWFRVGATNYPERHILTQSR